MFRRLFKAVLPKDDEVLRAKIYRRLLREDAKMGGQLFGPVPENVRREFFCLDEHTWVWHEEWTDESGTHRILTTRYDVRPHGIFKAQDGQPYRPVSREEVGRLLHAMYEYNRVLDAQLSPVLGVA